MADGALPITFRAGPRLFEDPGSRKFVPQEIDPERFRQLCPKLVNVPSANTASLPPEKVEENPAFTVSADFNGDGLNDLVSGYRDMSHAKIQLHFLDGRDVGRKTSVPVETPFVPLPLSGGTAFLTQEPSQFCVADANGDKLPDLLWTDPSDHQPMRAYYLPNQREQRREVIEHPEQSSSAVTRASLEKFWQDWHYLMQRLADYRARYGKAVIPRLVEAGENHETVWELQYQVDEDYFNVSSFPDPTGTPYEGGALTNRTDPEIFLNDRLEPREWGVALRFGSFIPSTFQVNGNTTPIGFMAGVMAMVHGKHWGLSGEYDYGRVGIFPDGLQNIDSGASVNMLPINKPLPVELDSHTFSATPFWQYTFFNPALAVHLLGGLGPFYEHGTIINKQLNITPDLKVDVITTRDTYQALGPRLRIGGSIEKWAFQGGLEVMVDFGLPLGGEFEDFSKYLFRSILLLTVGYRQALKKSDSRR